MNPRALGQDLSSLGQLVDTLRTRTRALVIRDSWSAPRHLGHGAKSPGTSDRPRGSWKTAHYARESRSTLQDFGHGPESTGTADQARGHSDPGPSHLGLLVQPAGPRTQAGVTWEN